MIASVTHMALEPQYSSKGIFRPGSAVGKEGVSAFLQWVAVNYGQDVTDECKRLIHKSLQWSENVKPFAILEDVLAKRRTINDDLGTLRFNS